jgi:hypothetical protein
VAWGIHPRTMRRCYNEPRHQRTTAHKLCFVTGYWREYTTLLVSSFQVNITVIPSATSRHSALVELSPIATSTVVSGEMLRHRLRMTEGIPTVAG